VIGAELGLNVASVLYTVDQLARLFLLETDTDGPEQRKKKLKSQRHWLMRISLLRKDLITTDLWMDRVYQVLRLKYVFSPRFGVALLVLYTGALLLYLHYQEPIQKALETITQWNGSSLGFVAISLALDFVICLFHELAHGFACKHFGGKVQALGVGLYFFRPVFYCDVTDAWAFPKRHQRLVTHAAGMAMNFFLTSLALLFLPLGARIHWLWIGIILILLVACIRAVINFNPLIRLDGYYLLADFLRIENLRQKAFNFLFSSVRLVLYTLRITRVPPAQQMFRGSLREKLIFLLYGVFSVSYTAIWCIVLAISYTHLLARYLGLWSWPLLCLGIAVVVMYPLWTRWEMNSRKHRAFHKYQLEHDHFSRN
jgi:putative peptide zinc metalloprotease protein